LNAEVSPTSWALAQRLNGVGRRTESTRAEVRPSGRSSAADSKQTRRRIAKDLDEVQQAARGKRTTTARRPSTTRRRSAGRSASAKK
jgi:hypothetical protein